MGRRRVRRPPRCGGGGGRDGVWQATPAFCVAEVSSLSSSSSDFAVTTRARPKRTTLSNVMHLATLFARKVHESTLPSSCWGISWSTQSVRNHSSVTRSLRVTLLCGEARVVAAGKCK